MGEARRFSVRTIRLAGVLAAFAAVSACDEAMMAGGKPAAPEAGSEAPTRAARGELRDVEAPDVFSVSEAGLWDGRPSLGGIWVAHPDVTAPERVTIRNTANGKSVTGALFRRERDIPGPRLQASSDAASALGMLGGAPVKLEVVALRREEAAPVVVAEAAPEPAPARAAVVRPPEKSADPVVAGAAVAIEEDAAQPAAKEPLFKRMFGRKPEAAESEAATSAPSVEAAPQVATSELPAAGGEAVAAEAAPPARKPLFGGVFKAKDKPVGEPLSVLAPAEATPVAAVADPAPAKRVSKLGQPFLQIGIFAEEGNANRTAEMLGKAGMVPTVRSERINGKDYWRVVVGPARNTSERDTLLSKVKQVGFRDAYPVSN
ncbi:MAG: SPOR domain-containing protein [Pseudooceanicola sp.]|nr:SPOR domain-containing protein [Pseudooceanicola sp.]